jgi:uncharacterized LabA/DUF88 family protein
MSINTRGGKIELLSLQYKMVCAAVYIDADNMGPISIKKGMEHINDQNDNVIIKKIYGDWSKPHMKKRLNESNNLGISQIQCGRLAKNSSDISMCIDIIKDLYTNPNIDIFYIVSSDSDFSAVMHEIKCCNKKVNCICNRNSNSMLHESCSKVIYIESNTVLQKEKAAKVEKEKAVKVEKEKAEKVEKENAAKVEKENAAKVEKENAAKKWCGVFKYLKIINIVK